MKPRDYPHSETCTGKHTKCPVGYLQWHEWASKKSKTHKQKKCDGCNLYAIWVEKKPKLERIVIQTWTPNKEA